MDNKQDEIVIFPFDSLSVPLRHGLQLMMNEGLKLPKPALTRGKPGSPDSVNIAYYGTVIKVGDVYRMWYLGGGDLDEGEPVSWYRAYKMRVCYAESPDGIIWEKPSLGLVDYGGSKENNLVKLECEHQVFACVVLYEPDDPDHSKRYKMSYEVIPGALHYVAFSHDGYVWENSSKNPVNKVQFEQSGLTKVGGLYCLTGQSTGIRRLTTLLSYDFENWNDAYCVGFKRDDYSKTALVPQNDTAHGKNSGEQVHLGASLWLRRGIILGFYGQWHGPDYFNGDRRGLNMDIGLVYTHDGLNYNEPLPDFRIVSATELAWPELMPGPRITQGQGFENIGDKTYFWFGIWGPGGGNCIRTAVWDKDRLGCLYPLTSKRQLGEGQVVVSGLEPHFITTPFDNTDIEGRLYINASGITENSYVVVEILNENFTPINGFYGDDCIPIKSSDFHKKIEWKNTDLSQLKNRFRIKVIYKGIRLEDAQVYALYLI